MLTIELWKLWNVITFWWLNIDADTRSTSQTLDDKQAQGSISEITALSAPMSLVTAWYLKTGSEPCEEALVDAIRRAPVPIFFIYCFKTFTILHRCEL